MADQFDHGPEKAEDLNRHMLNTFFKKAEKHFPQSNWTYVFFYSTRSFRHTLYDGYKSNRTNVWQPPLKHYYREVITEMTDGWMYEGYEADDLVSIVRNQLASGGVDNHDVVVISNDKDLDQIPGEHFNPATNELYTVSEQDARLFKYAQWIHGDSTDGFTGIRGIGPIKANDFLQGIKASRLTDEQVEKHIRAFYKKKGQKIECETFRRLAWLLTDVLGAPLLSGA